MVSVPLSMLQARRDQGQFAPAAEAMARTILQLRVYHPAEFEIFPDGSVVWRDTITGREEVIARLQEFSKQTANEVRLIHIPTNSLIGRMNTHVDDKPADSTAG